MCGKEKGCFNNAGVCWLDDNLDECVICYDEAYDICDLGGCSESSKVYDGCFVENDCFLDVGPCTDDDTIEACDACYFSVVDSCVVGVCKVVYEFYD